MLALTQACRDGVVTCSSISGDFVCECQIRTIVNEEPEEQEENLTPTPEVLPIETEIEIPEELVTKEDSTEVQMIGHDQIAIVTVIVAILILLLIVVLGVVCCMWYRANKTNADLKASVQLTATDRADLESLRSSQLRSTRKLLQKTGSDLDYCPQTNDIQSCVEKTPDGFSEGNQRQNGTEPFDSEHEKTVRWTFPTKPLTI